MSALRSGRGAALTHGEPPQASEHTRLEPAFALVRAWAGPELVSLVVAGSHATGDAVWADVDGRTVSLSDLDVWAVMRDGASARAASARARAGRAAAAGNLRALGLVAPLETGFVTRTGLAGMPAKPGTIDLKRRGRVVWGDATVLASVPDWKPGDISREERTLLLENRAFELLFAWPDLGHADALTRLLARHAVLKTAVDLATVEALSEGELPEGRAARIAWARACRERRPAPDPHPHRFGSSVATAPPLWDAALAFAVAPAAAPSIEAARAEWRECARAWADLWWSLATPPPWSPDPWDEVAHAAARAPFPRRLRRALTFTARSGAGPSRTQLLRFALAGTPQHRVNGSGVALVLAAAESPGAPALPSGALRVLAELGVVPAADARDWESARQAVTRAWDRWLHDGARTEEGR